jgi:hypothetical protein
MVSPFNGSRVRRVNQIVGRVSHLEQGSGRGGAWSNDARGWEGRWDLKRKDDDLAFIGVLHVGITVGLEAREGRERDLFLTGILPPHSYVTFVESALGRDPLLSEMAINQNLILSQQWAGVP